MNGGMGSYYLNVLKSRSSLSILQAICSNKKYLNPLFFHIDRDFILDVGGRYDRIFLFRMVESPVR